MREFNHGETIREFYKAMADESPEGLTNAALIQLVLRLMVEVEALREALSNPKTPEVVRQSYRRAYERISVLSHSAAGLSCGNQKVMSRFIVPKDEGRGRFASQMAMLARLGATEEEQQALADKMEAAMMYT